MTVFSSARSLAANQAATSFSTAALSGQPNQAFSPLPRTAM